MKTFVVVQLNFAATHYWKKANGNVSFLRHKHRHQFHITCKKEVSHGDREIEILTLKESIEKYLRKKYRGNIKGRSCEHLAAKLLKKFQLSYCSVLEDGENGAEVYY